MRNDMAHSTPSAGGALEGLLNRNGGKPPMLRAIHEAAADVEKSLKFWKKMVKKIPSQHRARERLNRQG
jgi:hypothetical protein